MIESSYLSLTPNCKKLTMVHSKNLSSLSPNPTKKKKIPKKLLLIKNNKNETVPMAYLKLPKKFKVNSITDKYLKSAYKNISDYEKKLLSQISPYSKNKNF